MFLIILLTVSLKPSFGQWSDAIVCKNCISKYHQYMCYDMNCKGFQVPVQEQFRVHNTYINCGFIPQKLNEARCYYKSSQTLATITYLFCNYTMPNCLTCQNYSSCSKCDEGYFLNVDPHDNTTVRCQKCISKCLKCLGLNYCIECEKGFINEIGFCQHQSVSEKEYYYKMLSFWLGVFVIIFVILYGLFVIFYGQKQKQRLQLQMKRQLFQRKRKNRVPDYSRCFQQ